MVITPVEAVLAMAEAADCSGSGDESSTMPHRHGCVLQRFWTVHHKNRGPDATRKAARKFIEQAGCCVRMRWWQVSENALSLIERSEKHVLRGRLAARNIRGK